MEQKTAVRQYTNCWEFHGPKPYEKPARCKNCGLLALNCRYAKDPFPTCANCRGPHQADHAAYAARPATANGRVVRPSKEQLKAVRTLGTRATAAARAATSPTPSPETSPTPPSPTMSAIRGRIPVRATNRPDLEMTGALPAPEEQPPTQEEAPYNTYANEGFAHYQYLLVDVEDSEEQPTPTIDKLPNEAERREDAED